MTIRRGGYVAVLAAFVMIPWNLLSKPFPLSSFLQSSHTHRELVESSNSFTTYLSAYSVFLSSIIGVLISDYYLIRRGKLYPGHLYSYSRDGYAWYKWGINWRAYVAYIFGIIPNTPGFGGAVDPSKPSPIVAKRIYQLNFL
jgi:NCS1 family nucleobase:cation symporter-1